MRGDLKHFKVTRYENSIKNRTQNYDQGLLGMIISNIIQLSPIFAFFTAVILSKSYARRTNDKAIIYSHVFQMYYIVM